jgi:molecular chaperone HtpG
VNPEHQVIKKIISHVSSNSASNEDRDVINILYDQACIIDGEPVNDPAGFAKRINAVLLASS